MGCPSSPMSIPPSSWLPASPCAPSLSQEILALPEVGMVQKRGVPATPPHTHMEGWAPSCDSPARGWLHRSRGIGSRTSVTHPSRDTSGGMGRLREEATRGSLQSLAPCPEPWDVCLRLRSGVSTGLRALWTLRSIKWGHQIRGVGCGPIPHHPIHVSPQGAGLRRVRSWGWSSFQGGLPPKPGPSGGCQEAGSMRGARSQSASRGCWDSAGGGGGIISCH